MILVSSKDFATNQEKYFELALDEQVFVKRGDYVFHLLCSNIDTVNIKEQATLAPDDNLRRTITMDELRESAHEHIHQLFASR